MICVQLFDLSFQYDVHSLIKAFHQTEDVSVAPIGRTEEPFTGYRIDDAGGKLQCAYYEDAQLIRKTDAPLFDTDRTGLKNLLKRTLYGLLSAQSGRELPWGTLTGIRPVKIPMKMLSDGRPDEEIRAHMKQTYLVSDAKTDLALGIAKRERSILSTLHTSDGFSLYIGIPFCPTTCMYCSFTSYPIGKYAHLTDAYLNALDAELKLVSEVYGDRILDTVYIGGGTPTTLEPEQMLLLHEMLDRYFDLDSVLEFTMEAGRPDSITAKKLATMYETGINRISVNPQTMHDETLSVIGRRHTTGQTVDAFHMAREAGFSNINMDIILGLPGEDICMVAETLEKIACLAPDALTVHSMAIKRAAAMHDYLSAHPEMQSINTPEMMDLCTEYADKMEMYPYYLYRQKNMAGNFENVGYARDGKYGLYNILIMEEVQSIAAVGAGTISKAVLADGRIERCDTVKDVTLYLSSIDQVIGKKRDFYTRMKQLSQEKE
ncbi:MAG: coproporphyrinogen dehydrogenase HemZ [Lachnospiraceae bacterium]|nr:coproporphyrinogen dehydrogenase HemZ [Lachnospiraceae bacterium]